MPVRSWYRRGSGALAFGSGLLWYGAVVALFMGGRWLFESRNVFFIFLLGIVLGAVHFALVQMMATLQEYVRGHGLSRHRVHGPGRPVAARMAVASTFRARFYRS